MKSKSKKFLSLFLAVVMVIAVIPLGAVTATAETSGDFEYSVISEEEKTCQITKYNGTATELTIPSQLNEYTVTSIGNAAFRNCTSLASVIIGNSVTSIGGYAFENCSSLENITIPDGVTWIEDSAFDKCTSLENICVGEGNNNYCDIDGVLFNKDATKLKCYPSGKRGDYTIPDGVTYIPYDAFDECTSLENIYVGEGNNNYCDIDGVLFNKDATELKCYPSGKRGDYIIPDGVENIAFSNCTLLTSVTIPDSVTWISSTFSNCTSLQNIFVNSGNNVYCDIDGVLFSKDATELKCYPSGKRGDYTIPDGVTWIDRYAFRNCASLTSVIIPNGVRSITECTFYGCNLLENVVIPDSVTSISESAFYFCDSLVKLTIPSSVTEIGDPVYGSAKPFSGCHYLVDIEVDVDNPEYSSIGGVLFNKDATKLISCPSGKSGDYTIPNSVTAIAGYAFEGCSSLKSITIPDSVTSIGGRAFACRSLESVTIPKSVTYIGYAAFDGCGNLTIYGYSGSYAETYANENSIPFVALTEPSIVQFDKSQIRFHGVGADKDFSNYKDTFDVRTVAKISQEDFRNTFGTDEEALKNITDIGFIYAAEKNVTTFDLETAKKVAEGTGTDENYIKKSVSNIQHTGDGADYIFTCIVTDVPDADKEQKGYCFAYVCCNGTYYYFDDVTVMDFNALYTANKPQA